MGRVGKPPRMKQTQKNDANAKAMRSNCENFLDGPKIFQKLDRLDAVDFVKKSSKSELSSQFSGRLKFLAVFADCAVQCQQKRKNKKRHFLANSADHPRIYIETFLLSLQIERSPGRLSEFFEKWRVDF